MDRLGPGGGAPGLRHPGVPHPARPPLPVPGGGRAGGRVRLRPHRRGAHRARRAGRLADHARADRHPGRVGGQARHRPQPPAHRLDHRSRAGHRRRCGGLGRPGNARPDRRGRPGQLVGRRAAPQGAARQQAGRAGLRRARLAARRHRPGHPDRRVPGPPRPAVLRPDRPGAALPAPGAARRRPGVRPAHPRRAGRRGCGRAEPDAPGPGHPRPGRRDRRRAVPRRRAVRPADGRGRAAADAGAGRHGEHRHRRRHRLSVRAGGALRRRGEGRRAGRVRGGGPGVQPRLAQAAAGDPLHRAGPAEDQEDQDGLHHRRRRPAVALRADSRTRVLAHLLRHRDVAKLKSTVDGLLKSVSDDGRIHTTFNQTVAATGRLSSTEPNLQNIPIRTEEGRRIRRAFVVGEGYESPAHRRLQPDRDAHHGAPVVGRRADRGVQLRRRLPRRHRLVGLRGAARRGHPRPAPQDQGHELRPGVRADAPSACPSSSGSAPKRRAG